MNCFTPDTDVLTPEDDRRSGMEIGDEVFVRVRDGKIIIQKADPDKSNRTTAATCGYRVEQDGLPCDAEPPDARPKDETTEARRRDSFVELVTRRCHELRTRHDWDGPDGDPRTRWI